MTRTHKIFMFSPVLFAIIPALLSPYQQGALDARADIINSTPRYLVYGLQKDGRAFFAEMQRTYGVTVDAVAGCVVDQKIIDHARGYNEVMLAHLNEKYGEDVLATVRQKLRKQREQLTRTAQPLPVK